MADQNNPISLVVSSFTKGEVTDLDPTMQNNQFFESADNIRIMNHQGHGLVITNIRGSEYSISEGSPLNKGFRLTTGYVPIGACLYNGILYICSAYKTRVDNEDYSIGEIGCYPSMNPSTGKFSRDYRPLQNWDEDGNGSTDDFRTAYLKFHRDKPMDVIPWETADGSVNLYLADGYEPLRVINTGFDQDGNDAGIIYTANHFPNAVNMAMSGGKTLIIGHQNSTDDYVQSGGALPYGNIFFFFRYVDQNLNHTHFVGESRPCQIFKGQSNVHDSVGGFDGQSDKKVCFNLSNLDTAYTYIEVGYLRYFSGEDGVTTYEVALVDKEYPIGGNTDIDIEITGTEGTRVLSIDELTENRDIDDTCETIHPLEGRLWGANWTSITHHHQSMADFALKVTVDIDITKQIDATVYTESPEALSLNVGEYKVTNYVADYVGYFRTEAYPFALRFELNNGYLSAPYPITGKDFWQSGNPTNTSGIVRFPAGTNSSYKVFDTGVVQVMGITFDFETAFTDAIANNDPDDLGWLKQNVRAIHIVRGERKKTLEYQGLGVLGCTPRIADTETANLNITEACSYGTTPADHEFHPGYDDSDNGSYYAQFRDDYAKESNLDFFWGSHKDADSQIGADDPDEEFYREDIVMPLFRAYAPHHYSGENIDWKLRKVTRNRNYMARWFIKKNKLAIFSPDLIFGGRQELGDIKLLQSQVKTLPTHTQYADTIPNSNDKWYLNHVAWTGYSDVYPNVYSFELTNPTALGTKSETNFTSVSLVGGGAWFTPATHKDHFANRTKDLYSSDIDAMYYAVNNKHSWTNRAIKTPDFIGITLDDASQTADDNWNGDIINVYNRTDPENDDITSYFSNLATVRYHKIGTQIETVDWDAITPADHNDEVRYGGDCFLQRTYFKIQSWPGTAYNADGYIDEDPESESMLDLIDKASATDGHEKSARFSHGVLVSIVTENAVNLANRSTHKLKTYYPKIGNLKTMALTPETDDRGESKLVNKGYSSVLSPLFAFGYSSIYPTSDKRKKSRIRFSDVNSSESFIDGFRKFRLNNFRDFEVNKGAIKKLIEMQGYLISIQEKAINLHYINERQMRNDPNSGEIVFGTGEILSPKWRTLSDFGSQHKTSITMGLKGVYGVDFFRRKIWRLQLGQAGVAAQDLGAELYNSKSIQELFDRWSLRGDIINKLPDSPMNHYGIVTVYDPKFDEIYFVFVNQEATAPQGYPFQTS